MFFTNKNNTLAVKIFAFSLCLAACGGGDDAQAPAQPAQDMGAQDSGANNGDPNSDDPNNGALNNGDPDLGPDVAPDLPDDGPSRDELRSGLPADRLMQELSEEEREALCAAVGDFEYGYTAQIKPFRCLALSFDAAQFGDDPALSCERARGACDLIPLSADFYAQNCLTEFLFIGPYSCREVTVSEFEACTVQNLVLELGVRDRAALTCAEAVTREYVLPEGYRDCACGVPVPLGPPLPDDLDRDGVPNDRDLCPETPNGLEVSAVGCTGWEDDDNDLVPNTSDACPDTEPDPIGLNEVGCSLLQRDLDRDGVLDDEGDLCLNTEPEVEVSALGCSRAQDGDFDGVINREDWCPDTPAGQAPGARGCSVLEDEDQDGTRDEHDRCPLTPSDEPTTGFGCSASQDWGPQAQVMIVDAPPEGAVTLTLGEQGPSPVRVAALSQVITETVDGYHIQGTLLMEIPETGQYLVLPDSDVTLSRNPQTGQGLMEIRGEVTAPFPSFGLLQGASVTLPRASIGYAPGSSPSLDGVRVPLEEERWYLWLTLHTELSARLGMLEIELYADRELRLVLDLFDPFFAAQGDVSGLGPLRLLRNVAIGFSSHGLIDYQPEITWGVEEVAQPFEGHIFLQGELPIPNQYLPEELAQLVLNGTAVVDVDPERDGIPVWGVDSGVRLGGSGDLTVEFSFVPSIPMRFTLGEASVGGELLADSKRLYGSGVLRPDNFVFFRGIPLRFPAGAQAAFLASPGRGESYFVAEGMASFDSSALPIPLPGLAAIEIEGRVYADEEGVTMMGRTRQALSSQLSLEGEVEVAVEFAWRGNWSVRLYGRFDIHGQSNNLCELAISSTYGLETSPCP